MWLSSWATTPSSSTRFIFSSRPVVTAIAACFGSRPVANALGAGSSTTYTPGLGSPPAMHSPSTMLCSRAYSCGSAGWARLTASAILSAFQYETNATTAPITSATIVAAMPLPKTRPKANADQRHDDDEADDEQHAAALVRSDQVVHVWGWCGGSGGDGSCGGTVAAAGSELDGRRRACRLVGLEVLAPLEVEHPGVEHRGELLELVVVLQHGVVVELPGVGDPALGGRQLLLQCQEVLVGLQVGVRLAECEQLPQRAGELALGGRRARPGWAPRRRRCGPG